MVIEPLAEKDGEFQQDEERAEGEYSLGGASVGIGKDISRLTFGTGGKIQYHPRTFQGRTRPEYLEDGPRRSVDEIAS